MRRRATDVIGNNLSDPFYDSYEQESFVVCDILDKIDRCKTDLVNITFTKSFLKKIIHSHLLHIRELEKGLKGIVYAH